MSVACPRLSGATGPFDEPASLAETLSDNPSAALKGLTCASQGWARGRESRQFPYLGSGLRRIARTNQRPGARMQRTRIAISEQFGGLFHAPAPRDV